MKQRNDLCPAIVNPYTITARTPMNTTPFKLSSTRVLNTILASVLLLGGTLHAADMPALSAELRQRIDQALPAKATVRPVKPRRLLIFTRNLDYKGHDASIASACAAFTRMGKRTGALDARVSGDPAVFERASLQQFDAVFLKAEEVFRELHRLGIKPTMIGPAYSYDWCSSMPRLAQCIQFFNATTLKMASETDANP